jgi:two-component system, NtrC family, sensor histidine kinase HydH
LISNLNRSRTGGSHRSRVAVLAVISLITLGIHYGWLLRPFGDAHWLHAIHGRLCYIPIVMAAAWFGLRGGLIQAAVISVLVLPYVLGSNQGAHDLAGEWVEIFFYFAVAVLVGLLVEREYAARHREQEAQLQVERSQKLSLAGQIAAGVAHEIKNPLASIKGAADILADEASSPSDRAEFAALLHNEIRRIDSTVKDFLEFARPREAKLEAMDLSEALRVPLRQLEAQARERGVAIESQIEPGLAINGDSEKLHQLVLNLLLNAVQASPAGSAIRVSLAGRDDGKVSLEVSDRGMGVEPEHLTRIFEPFFTTRTSGTGLGLPIAKGIVERHGGTIAVRSRPGEGTRVIVELPRLERGRAS